MKYNLISKTSKRTISALLVFAVVFGAYSPSYAPRAQAIIPVTDYFQKVLDMIDRYAPGIAQAMIDRMVKSTIKWANSGFEGNPAYITDPGQYFGNVASGVVGEAINDSKLGFLCSPFQAQIRLSLVKQYVDDESNYQCTLEQIGVNIEDFYQDFDEGGWDAWIKMTQDEQNTPQGAYLRATLDADSRINEALGVKKDEWMQNLGFQSQRSCRQRNVYPPQEIEDQWMGYATADWPAPWNNTKYYNPGYPEGTCLDEGSIKTPGRTIGEQINGVLPSGLQKLIQVNDMDQLVGAFAAGLLNRYVFGSKGLFGDGYSDHFSNSSKPSNKSGGYDWKFCSRMGEFCTFTGSETVRLRWREWDGNGVRNMTTWYAPEQKVPNTSKKTKEMDFSGGTMCSEEVFELEKGFNERDVIGTPWCEIMGYVPPAPPAGTDQYGENYLSCAPDREDIVAGERSIWIITTTYPEGTIYGWASDELVTKPTENKSTNKFLEMFYETEGVKFAQVTIFDGVGGELRTVDCAKQIVVSPKE